MMNREKRLSTAKIILVTLILATLAFILINSMLPPEISSAESNSAGGFFALIFPEGTFLHTLIVPNIRKIAHFAEFFALGTEIALYVCFYTRRYSVFVPASFFALQTVALLDETVQIFSGRGPSVSDVWLDTLGGVCAYLLVYTPYFLISKINNRRTK